VKDLYPPRLFSIEKMMIRKYQAKFDDEALYRLALGALLGPIAASSIAIILDYENKNDD